MKCKICSGSGFEKIYLDMAGLEYEHRICRGCSGTGESKPRVLNKHVHGVPKDAVYIGQDGNRDEVIEKYIKWFLEDPSRVKRAKIELRDKNLVCYCSPSRCHGDFLLELANMERDQ